MRKPALVAAVALAVLAVGWVLAPLVLPRAPAVVLYCSVDQDQFQPVIADFEQETGVKVDAVGETEANRSVGITKRLELELPHPVADLLWANEIMNTVALAEMGAFDPLPAGAADGFPAAWRDPKGRFVAFAGRARILLVNKRRLPDPATWPSSVADLLSPRYGAEGLRCAMARPLVGTTYAHAVALLTRDPEAGKAFLAAVAARAEKGEVKLYPGNGSAMRAVSAGEVAWCLTDTDDARVAIEAAAAGRGDPVEVVYPDQGAGQPGTMVIPNTVALVRGGRRRADAERLLRWLVRGETEQRLAAGPIANIPLREGVPVPAHVRRPGTDFRALEVDWLAVGRDRDRWLGVLQGMFQAK